MKKESWWEVFLMNIYKGYYHSQKTKGVENNG